MNIKNNKNCKITINDEEITVSEKGKTADEMLNDIGYVKYLDNEEKIIYKYERETFRVSLTFDKREFKNTFYATEAMWVANNEGWYTQKFKNEWDKYCAAQGYWSSIWHEFSIEELQAINKKVEELGWNEKS